jgi:hypothetical protein
MMVQMINGKAVPSFSIQIPEIGMHLMNIHLSEARLLMAGNPADPPEEVLLLGFVHF